jgi:hypothetical protein
MCISEDYIVFEMCISEDFKNNKNSNYINGFRNNSSASRKMIFPNGMHDILAKNVMFGIPYDVFFQMGCTTFWLRMLCSASHTMFFPNGMHDILAKNVMFGIPYDVFSKWDARHFG